MKPRTQSNSTHQTLSRDPRGLKKPHFPQTDRNYQPLHELRGGSTTTPANRTLVPDLRTFRKISSEFFGTETARTFVGEALYFAAIVALAAWPIGDMLTVIAARMQH